MKVTVNELKRGNAVEHKGRLWMVVKKDHITPGKGGAFIQLEFKDIRDGTKLNERFRSGETIERARLDQREYQYLFGDDDGATFMDQESFEQLMVNRELIGDQAIFLRDGMVVTIDTYEGAPLSVTLPDTVVMQVVEADPVVKGQTASSSYKPATLENGARTMVPPFIGAGDKIVVKPEDSSYVERAKS